MKILVKYPTRQRPELFLKVLKEYIDKAADNSNITYLISYDVDDETMTSDVLATAALMHDNVMLRGGSSKSKIHACNRDIETLADWSWDIILLISDDMFVQQYGWDTTIAFDMQKYFPNTDGCLWYHDGSKQRIISTLSCMGRKYFERLGYLYHPSYKSFFCDNEYTEKAMSEGKMIFIENVIIKHEHPAWGGAVKGDDLYSRNDKAWNEDQSNYNMRKAAGYPAVFLNLKQ